MALRTRPFVNVTENVPFMRKVQNVTAEERTIMEDGRSLELELGRARQYTGVSSHDAAS